MLGDSPSLSRSNVRTQEERIPAAITDIGCEREINEDRYAVIDSPAGRAWIVCDGMGGAVGGELAAQLAIDSIRRTLESRQFDYGGEALRACIEEANRVIVLRRQNPAFSTMGTTVVGVLVHDDELVVTHAGDSRAYLYRGGQIQQLTVDHTYVQDLVDRGSIAPEEALSHPQSHVLTRCLGAEPRLELDVQNYWIGELGVGDEDDTLLLCSDGLYSLVSDAEIARALGQGSPQKACVELVELAKERGGFDNITVAVLPLGGRLEEATERRPRAGVERKRRAAEAASRPSVMGHLSTGRKIAIAMILAILSSVLAAVGALVMFS